MACIQPHNRYKSLKFNPFGPLLDPISRLEDRLRMPEYIRPISSYSVIREAELISISLFIVFNICFVAGLCYRNSGSALKRSLREFGLYSLSFSFLMWGVFTSMKLIMYPLAPTRNNRNQRLSLAAMYWFVYIMVMAPFLHRIARWIQRRIFQGVPETSVATLAWDLGRCVSWVVICCLGAMIQPWIAPL